MISLLPVAEAAIAAMALVMMIGTLTTPAVVRELRARGVGGIVLVLVVVGCIALVALALRNAQVRHVGALLLGAAVLAAVVRARPGFGARRGLPPGSLGVRASLLAVHDRDFHAREARRWGPIYKTAQVHRPVACIADVALGRALLQRSRERVRQTSWAANRLAPGGYVEFMNGAQHRRYRHLLASALEDVDGSNFGEEMAAMVDAHLDREIVLARGAPFHPRRLGDSVAFESLARVVLGISPAHAQWEPLSRALDSLGGPVDPRLPLSAGVKRARDEVFAAMHALGDADDAPHHGRPTSLLSSLVMRDRAALEDPTVVGNLLFMMTDGRVMLQRLLTWIVAMGAAHPEQLVGLRGEAGGRGAESFVLEVLRLCVTEYVYRVAATDLEVDGYRIPKGWLIRICLRECHRRPDLFDAPDRFDPSRFERGEGTPDTFAPWGFEAHACFWAPTVMYVATTFARRMAEVAEWARVSDGAAQHWNRHWTFWEASADLRVTASRYPRQ